MLGTQHIIIRRPLQRRAYWKFPQAWVTVGYTFSSPELAYMLRAGNPTHNNPPTFLASSVWEIPTNPHLTCMLYFSSPELAFIFRAGNPTHNNPIFPASSILEIHIDPFLTYVYKCIHFNAIYLDTSVSFNIQRNLDSRFMRFQRNQHTRLNIFLIHYRCSTRSKYFQELENHDINVIQCK